MRSGIARDHVSCLHLPECLVSLLRTACAVTRCVCHVYLLDVGSVNNDQIMQAIEREEKGRSSQADHEACFGQAGRRA